MARGGDAWSRSVAGWARTVAGAADPGARVAAAGALRGALDRAGRLRAVRSLLGGELSHADACPRILAACAAARAPYAAFCDRLAVVRGAELAHPRGDARPMRGAGRTSLARIAALDGEAAARDPLRAAIAWLSPIVPPAARGYAIYWLWRQAFIAGDAALRDELWRRWPAASRADRSLVFALADAARGGAAPLLGPAPAADREVARLALTLYHLARARIRDTPTRAVAIRALVDCAQPALVARKVAFTLGSLAVRGLVTDGAQTVDALTAPPAEGALYDDAALIGFCGGIVAGKRALAGPPDSARLDHIRARLGALVPVRVDAFGRCDVAIQSALVALAPAETGYHR